MTDLMFAQSVTRKYVIGGGKSCSAPQSSTSSQSTSGASSPVSSVASSLSSSPTHGHSRQQQQQQQQRHQQLVRSNSAIVDSGLSVVDHGGRSMQQSQQSTQQSSQAVAGSSNSGNGSPNSGSARQSLPRRTEFDNKDRRRLNVATAATIASSSAPSSVAAAAAAAASSSSPTSSLSLSSSSCVVNQAVLDLKIEANRRLTYDDWPVAFISPDELARQGFFYFKHRDYARCVFCGVQINEWIEGDVVADEHKRWSPKCPFVRGCDVGNVPLQALTTPTIPRTYAVLAGTAIVTNGSSSSSGNSRVPLPVMPSPSQQTVATSTTAPVIQPVGYDTCGIYGIEIRPNSVPERLWPSGTATAPPPTTTAAAATSNSSSSAIQFNLRNTAVSSGPQYPSMNSYESRLQSFNEWPRGLPRRPNELAEAGFFYTGNSDKVICFHCGGGLKNWGPNDNAWHNHAKWFSRCAFVLLQRGQDYVAEVSRIDRPLLNMKDAPELFRNQPQPQLVRQQTHQISYSTATAPSLPSNNRTSASTANARQPLLSSATNSLTIEATYPSQGNERSVASTSTTTATETAAAISLASAETATTSATSNSSSTTQSDPDDDNGFEIIELSTVSASSSSSQSQPVQVSATVTTTVAASVDTPNVSNTATTSATTTTDPETTSANQKTRPIDPTTATVTSSSSSVSDDRLCKICYNHELETALIPCHHVVACVNCAPSLSSCPVCKQPLQAIVRLFLC